MPHATADPDRPRPLRRVATAPARVAQWLWRRSRRIAVCGLVLGVLLRLTVRDSLPVLAQVYYATPPAVLMALAFALALGRARRRQWRGAAVWLLCGVGLTAWWRERSFVRPLAPGPAADHTLMSWNVCRGHLGWQGVRAAIRSHRPDLVALVEVTGDPDARLREWREVLPDYDSTRPRGGVMVMVRSAIGRIDRVLDAGVAGARVLDCRLTMDGSGLRLVVVDVASNPLRSRAGPLREIGAIAEQGFASGLPLILAGDFNTPSDSVHFAPLRRSMRNAFEAVGSGYACTWPVPLPVLDLDQIWLGGSVSASSCEATWSAHSDHRPLLLRWSD